MNDGLLACPVCGAGLARHAVPGTVRCGEGHSFDVARQGYVNLARPGAARGDDATMIGRREEFLARGHYEPIAAAVAHVAGTPPDGAVVELGAGTGWYLAQVLHALGGDRDGLALDASVAAARRAARCHPRAGAVVADVWGPLPVLDGVAALALGIFAPRNGPETARILTPGGASVIVTPTSRHLAEVKSALGLLDIDPDKGERLMRTMEPLRATGSEEVEYPMTLDQPALAELAGMGPSAHHAGASGVVDRIRTLGRTAEVTASVTVTRFER